MGLVPLHKSLVTIYTDAACVLYSVTVRKLSHSLIVDNENCAILNLGYNIHVEVKAPLLRAEE